MCTAMLQDLLERGLRVDESILCVVDGGKGIRKALVDVLGDLAVIQRCQIHKLRNLRSYLPKSRHAYVLQTMKKAYKCKSADKARKRLQALVSWLERNSHDEAAGSLREGMGRDAHGREARSARVTSPSLLPRRTPLRISTEPFEEYRETSSVGRVLRWFADGPLSASSRRRRSSGVSKAIAIWALSFTRLEANRNLLDSDEFAA